MSISERLANLLKRLWRVLDAAASAADYEPHEEYQCRLAAIEERLLALEQRSKRSGTGAGRSKALS